MDKDKDEDKDEDKDIGGELPRVAASCGEKEGKQGGGWK